MRFRPPEPGDAAAVLDLLVARDGTDLGKPDFTLGDLYDAWRATGFDLASDARVAVDGGAIVGYAAMTASGIHAAVKPGHERQGIGARLLAWAQERGRALGRTTHRQFVPASDDRARALLLGAGYSYVRSYWRMNRRLDAPESARALPDGVRVRALDREHDGESLYALSEASFALTADYQPEAWVRFREEHLEVHDLDTGLSTVAERGGRPVGFLLARRWTGESVGYVDLLAVHPNHQGQGIGTALLTHTFATFAAVGLSEAQLGVASDNPRALTLYERCGMSPGFRLDTYERPA